MFFLDFATILITGLMVGNELAVAAFIHPSISPLKPYPHLAAAKPIASTLGRVMPFWYALGLLTLIAETSLRHAQPEGTLFLAAALLWVATIVFTLAALVPRNNRIAKSDPDRPYPTWLNDRRQWDTRHRIRVALLTIAFMLALSATLHRC